MVWVLGSSQGGGNRPSQPQRHTTSLSVEIEKLSSNHANHKNAILEYMSLTEDTAVSLEKLFDPENADEEYQREHTNQLARLERAVKSYIAQLVHIDAHEEALKQLDELYPNSIPDDIADKLEELSRKNWSGGYILSDEDVKKDQRYRRFMNAVWDVHHPNEPLDFGDEDDVVVARGPVVIHDPITKMVMEHPVKSKVCGHVYEKDSIEELIRKGFGGECDCPVAGCNKRVRKIDLMKDREVELEIEKEIKRRKASSQQPTLDAVDLDDDDM